MSRSHRRLLAAALGNAIVVLLAPTASRAQATAGTPGSVEACLDAIPDRVLSRVPVYLEAMADAQDARTLLPAVDLAVQDVAERLRALLGAREGELPTGEPRVTWRSPDPDVQLVVYRDGRLEWTVKSDEGSLPSRGASATDLVVDALAMSRDSGQALVGPWPERLSADSVVLTLRLRQAWIDSTATARLEPPLRVGFPVYSLRVPPTSPVGMRRSSPPRYPMGSVRRGATGSVLMQFVVDTLGRAEMATLRDMWPVGTPPLTGERAMHYRMFVDAIRRSVQETEYAPARVGGCLVRQRVQQPFVFDIER